MNFFCVLDNCIWIGVVQLSLLRTGDFSSAGNVLSSSPKIWHVNKRDFTFQLTWNWSMNMINWLLGRFLQSLGTFTMLLVEGSYETGIFRHLSHYVFGFPNFEIPKSMTVIFFLFNMFKTFMYIWNMQQIIRKKFFAS